MTATMLPIKVAVVGHTNTGKTSLMRTLLRDSRFGDVSSRSSTTRHVEGAVIASQGETIIELYDTPGIEDPMALVECLENLEHPAGQASRLRNTDSRDLIQQFLTLPDAQLRFEQEAKVLRQMLSSTIGLYVIDARTPVLGKYLDELAILSFCGIPLLPVFNFIATAASQEEHWRHALAGIGLHTVLRFDTVVPGHHGDVLLYRKLATILDRFREPLEQLAVDKETAAHQRQAVGLKAVAELAIDVAAYRIVLDTEDDDFEPMRQQMQQAVRQREHQCSEVLLSTYAFTSEQLEEAMQVNEVSGTWDDDLFDPETLKKMGIDSVVGGAIGGAIGALIDLSTAGLSLGAATLLGGTLGAAWNSSDYLSRWVDKLQGRQSLAVNDHVVTLVAVRQLYLLQALQNRGHAALQPIEHYSGDISKALHQQLHKVLKVCRQYPAWSQLHDAFRSDADRVALLQSLSDTLEDFM